MHGTPRKYKSYGTKSSSTYQGQSGRSSTKLRLTVNRSAEMEFQREGRAPILVTRWGEKAWTKEIKKHINDDLLLELHDAARVAHDISHHEIPPRRKDIVGFPAGVDKHATMALLNNTIRKPNKEGKEGNSGNENVLEELDLELNKNQKHRATLHNIMAGSIRPNARLARSHGFKPRCRHGAEKEDVQHVFGHCPDHAHIKDKYDNLIQKVARQHGETQ